VHYNRRVSSVKWPINVSEIQPGADRTPSITSRGVDAAETGGIDVHIRVAEVGMVQQIDRIYAEFKLASMIAPPELL